MKTYQLMNFFCFAICLTSASFTLCSQEYSHIARQPIAEIKRLLNGQKYWSKFDENFDEKTALEVVDKLDSLEVHCDIKLQLYVYNDPHLQLRKNLWQLYCNKKNKIKDEGVTITSPAADYLLNTLRDRNDLFFKPDCFLFNDANLLALLFTFYETDDSSISYNQQQDEASGDTFVIPSDDGNVRYHSPFHLVKNYQWLPKKIDSSAAAVSSKY